MSMPVSASDLEAVFPIAERLQDGMIDLSKWIDSFPDGEFKTAVAEHYRYMAEEAADLVEFIANNAVTV